MLLRRPAWGTLESPGSVFTEQKAMLKKVSGKKGKLPCSKILDLSPCPSIPEEEEDDSGPALQSNGISVQFSFGLLWARRWRLFIFLLLTLLL